MIIDYIIKNPPIQGLLIGSVIIPILIVSLNSIKQNILLNVQIKLNKALDEYDDILDRLRLKVNSLEDREQNFQERVGFFMSNLDNKQDKIIKKLNDIEGLEDQLNEKMSLLQFQYNDIRQRLELTEPKLKRKLGQDTAPDKDSL